MTGHVYWRIRLVATAGGGAFGCDEIGMNTTVGGSSVTTGGTAFSDQAFSGFPASNAFDGNSGTLWSANDANDQSIGYHFASAVDIVEIKWTPRHDGNYNQSPAFFEVGSSDDGITYTPRWIVTNFTWANDTAVSFAKPTYALAGSHKGWGLVMRTGSAAAYAMSGLEIHATVGGSDLAFGSGGSALAAPQNFGSLTTANLFDNDTTTVWSSNDKRYGITVGYFLPTASHAAELALIARNDSNYAQAPATFDVISSDDGHIWLIEWSDSKTWASAGQVQDTTPAPPAPNETAVVTMHFTGIHINSETVRPNEQLAAVLHLKPIAITAVGYIPGAAGTGLRQFWTF